MNRRRFLKYAGATAAVVGASALGLDYFSQQSPSTVTSTTLTPLTRELSTTSASSGTTSETVQLASLRGRLFFDYNGNGVQDGEEPSVSGALVQLKDGMGKVVSEALTDSSGDYKLEDIRIGAYRLLVGVDQFSDKKLRYMCRSTEEFTAIPEGYGVLLDRSQSVDIGLMEGFLTLPFPKSVPIYVDPRRGDYFDHDPGLDAIWWNGRKLPAPRPHSPAWTHPGTDFFMPKGTEVRAASSGVIGAISTKKGEPYWIATSSRYGYGATYIHIDKPLVSTGMTVKRGEAIALSGDTGSPGTPHLEFQLWKHMPDAKDYCIDPYSPVPGVPRGAWIAGTWEWYPSDEEWISQGYWTRDNDPQYADT